MKIKALRRCAERNSGEAVRMRREFREHSDRSVTIARGLLGTPLGLSVSFGLGATVGVIASGRTSGSEKREDSQKPGRTHAVIADATTKLASALIVGALLKAGESSSDDAQPGAP